MDGPPHLWLKQGTVKAQCNNSLPSLSVDVMDEFSCANAAEKEPLHLFDMRVNTSTIILLLLCGTLPTSNGHFLPSTVRLRVISEKCISVWKF